MGDAVKVFLLTLSALFPIVDHSAFYPLTLPLTVGPGSISVAVTLGANSTRRYGFHIAIILAALMAMTAVAISILPKKIAFSDAAHICIRTFFSHRG